MRRPAAPLSAAWLAAAWLAACGPGAAPSAPARPVRPERIVSLDFCADQYVLELADGNAILALSPDAEKDFSYLRERAAGLPQVRPTLEAVLALQPDLVVRAYGGGPGMEAGLARAGIPVLSVGWADDLGAVRRVVEGLAEGLGQPERGRARVAEMDARLAALPPARDPPLRALYMTPGGVTTGPGSLIDDMIGRAGLINDQSAPGWAPIPLERLAIAPPDLVIAAFFDSASQTIHPWSAMRHPLARAQLRERPVIAIDGAATSCAAWTLLDAVEAIAAGGRDATPRP